MNESSTHVGRVTTRDDYETPEELWKPIQDFYQLTIDCAASVSLSKFPIYYSEENSFLTCDGRELLGQRCWLNPPFSLKEKFLARVVEVRNIASLFVCIVPNNARETDWWREQVWPHADEIISLSPRVNYFLDGKEVKGVPYPSCLVIYRPRLNAVYGAPREICWRWKEE